MTQKKAKARAGKKGRAAESRMDAFLKARAAVQEAERLRLAGELDKAAAICASVLKRFADYVAALQTLGLVFCDKGDFERALGPLQRASLLAPKNHRILTALSGAYLQLGFGVVAARTLEQARLHGGDDVGVLVTLGEIYRDRKEYELSRNAFEAAREIEPDLAAAQIGLALNLLQIGELERAADIFQEQVAKGSRSIAILYWLSQLPKSLVSVDLAALMEEARPAEGQADDGTYQAQLAFAWAATYDKLERYEEAWASVREARAFDQGKSREIYRRTRNRQAPLLNLVRRAQIRIPEPAPEHEQLPTSLFIIGPSRSGKTSLEKLVGTLEGVKRGYENPIVENAVERAYQEANFPTGRQLVELPPPLGKLFRSFYSEELCERAEVATVITNTMPGRIEDAMRVAEEIPNARFVFVKREQEDIAIRIYMRNYRTGNHYASNLNDIQEYVSWCHEMIDAMMEKLGERAFVVAYEDMVEDPGASCRKVADLCGLKMGEATLPDIGDDRGCAKPYRNFTGFVSAGE